jgi:hypothetical protein
MGTSGPGPFDGDDAYDVLDELEQSPTIEMVEDTLQFVLTQGYDGVEWERALAAAEVVAIMRGHPARKRSCRHSAIIDLVREHRMAAPQRLVDLALLVCQKALDEFELRERIQQYSEPQFCVQWIEAVRDLQKRLRDA